MRRRSGGSWVAIVILVTLSVVAVLALTATLNDDFRKWFIKYESGSTTIRNIGLLIAGIIAIALAVWRSRVADRQAAIAQRQAEIAHNQAAAAERGMLNERYQRGTEMLGSDVLSVRLGGIYSMQRLASEHPEEYHVQIMKSFCSFVRNPTADKTKPFDLNAKVREDVQAIMDAIGTRNDHHVALEKKVEYRLDLSGVSLRGANLISKNLQRVIITHSDLTNSLWDGANFEGALFMKTDLSGAFFPSAKNLQCRLFRGWQLSGL